MNTNYSLRDMGWNGAMRKTVETVAVVYYRPDITRLKPGVNHTVLTIYKFPKIKSVIIWRMCFTSTGSVTP
jgi:hypothetical protein